MAVHSSRVFQMNGDGAVLDACYTAAGDKVATCSNTGQIQIWSCTTSEQEWDLLHSEEVSEQFTSLAWAHPEHGQVLAVGTVSGVLVVQGPYLAPSSSHGNFSSIGQHRTRREGWCITDKLANEQGAVGAIAFAPRQLGLVLAVASHQQQGLAGQQAVGGSSCVLLYEAALCADARLQWTCTGQIKLPAGAGACRCLCWHDTVVGLPPLLVTGHDQGGSIWAYCQRSMSWQEKCSFSAPPGSSAAALQAVHWAPTLGRPHELLAASFGNAAVIYKVLPAAAIGNVVPDELGQLAVQVVARLQHPAAVWKLEFNRLGNALACSLEGLPAVWLWMPAMDGQWSVGMKLEGGQQAEQLDMD